MTSLNLSARTVQARRSVGMDRRAFAITVCLSVLVFVAFYAFGRAETQRSAPREAAPLRLPVTAAATAVPGTLSAAAPLALTVVVPVSRPHSTPAPHETPASVQAISSHSAAPAASAPVEPVVTSTPRTPAASAPASSPASTPSRPTSSGKGGSSTHEGGGTSFDSSG